MKTACRIFIGKSERRRAHGRRRQRDEYIKRDLTEIQDKGVNWSTDSGQCSLAFVSTVKNL
jgi:hypothetical protein